MPKELSYGTESPANNAIGGVPVIHYFDFQSRGRGQVFCLLDTSISELTWTKDAGAAYKDIRYSFDEWPEHKRTGKITDMNPCGNIPIIEMPNGNILTQSYSIIRHWARCLGAYDGKTEDEKYWADVICDIVVDWRTLFIAAFFSDNQKEDYPKHCSGDRKKYLDAITTHLKGSDISRRGPFVIGNEITYTDLVLYQVLHDENMVQNGRKDLQDWPRLVQLVDAVEARPNIKKFLQSDSYLG